MQFLASLPIVFTCSFVFLLAYLLSRVFTYVAHSVIHGSPTSTTKGAQVSSRDRGIESFKTQQLKHAEDAAVMARLQEEVEEESEDEEDDDDDDSEEEVHTSQFDMGGGIFDDISDQDYDSKREEYDSKRDDDAQCNNREGIIEIEGLDARHEGKYETRELEYRDINEDKIMKKLEDAEESQEEEGGAPNKSVLGDAQGSSSTQQRLPPTWSDLERMVNLSSQKQLVRPPISISQVPEDE